MTSELGCPGLGVEQLSCSGRMACSKFGGRRSTKVPGLLPEGVLAIRLNVPP